MTDELAYIERSIALAFERRDAYHVTCKAGYTICKTSLKVGGAYTASKGGVAILCEHFTTDAEQKAALEACKAACQSHYQGIEDGIL